MRRATVLVPSGPDHDPSRKHLFVLLTNPYQGSIIDGVAQLDDAVILVPISTIPTNSGMYHDSTCVLDPGDHPFIVNPSYVHYRHTRIQSSSTLQGGVQSGTFVARPMLDQNVFIGVASGLQNSRHTAQYVIDEYRIAQDCGACS